MIGNISKRAQWAAALTVVLAGLLAAAPARASVFIYSVSVPTDALITNSADGPFSFVSELTDGSGLGDSDNTVTLTNFNVTGPSSPIVLTDNSFLVFDQEDFTTNPGPGSTLDFTLQTTNNPNSPDPDEFSFFIFDNTDNPIPTTDPGSSLFTIDLGGFTPSVITFEGTSPYTGVNASVDLEGVVPEPSPLAVFAAAFFGLGALIALRKRTSRSAV
jgi:hypothetical protein